LIIRVGPPPPFPSGQGDSFLLLRVFFFPWGTSCFFFHGIRAVDSFFFTPRCGLGLPFFLNRSFFFKSRNFLLLRRSKAFSPLLGGKVLPWRSPFFFPRFKRGFPPQKEGTLPPQSPPRIYPRSFFPPPFSPHKLVLFPFPPTQALGLPTSVAWRKGPPPSFLEWWFRSRRLLFSPYLLTLSPSPGTVRIEFFFLRNLFSSRQGPTFLVGPLSSFHTYALSQVFFLFLAHGAEALFFFFFLSGSKVF